MICCTSARVDPYLVITFDNYLVIIFTLQKLADFGLAVRMQEDGAEQQTMCGTPNYISP